MKKTKLFANTLCLLSLCISMSVYAQDDTTQTGWQKSVVVDVTTTQTAYSNSWTGGENGSVNWVANLNGSAENQLREWIKFRSTLKLSFGQTIQQDDDNNWSKPKKSTDLIDWENVGRFTLHKFVDPYSAVRVQSQFVDASVDIKKRYLSPMKITESAGIAKEFYRKDNDLFVTRFGFGFRQIRSTEITDTVTLTTESVTSTDGGFESVSDLLLTFNEILRLTSKLTLYKALFYSEKDAVVNTPAENYWKAVDVNFENTFTAQLSKIIAVNLYMQLIYEKQQSLKGQLKETLGIGFIYKMI